MKDTIYRQQAIDAMWKIRRQQQMIDDTHKADLVMQGIYLAEKALEQLTSAQPDRKTGRWIEMGQNKDGTHNICCGVCGKFKIKSRGHANSAYTKSKYRFCGGCGARMDEE